MFARGLVTRNSLRAFLLGTALLLGSISQAQASDVQLDYLSSNNNFGNVALGEARFKFQVLQSNVARFNVGDIVWTYCISATMGLNDPDWYNIRNDIQNLPTPPSPMGTLAAVKINILINEVYGNGNISATLNTNNFAAIQDAIWYLINSANGANNTLVSAVNGIFSTYGSLAGYIGAVGLSGFKYIHGLDALSEGPGTDQSGQDQIYWDGERPPTLVDVPVPAGAVLAGMGIVFVGGFNYLRRRKAVVG